MKRYVNINDEKEVVKTCYLYEDEALSAAQRCDGFDYLDETQIDYTNFDVFESDVPDFSGRTSAYIAYDKDNNVLGYFGYWDVRDENED